MRRVLLTGSTGFVGAAIDRHLSVLPGVRVRRLVRGGRPSSGELVSGDLRDERSVQAAVAGVDVLIHAAGYSGPDPVLAWNVNDYGTRLLMHAAKGAGVPVVVSVSNTAVYGPGPHRGLAEGAGAGRPVTVAGRSRLAGDQHVLKVGGWVLRPHRVYGAGDQRFLSHLLRVADDIGAWVEGGAARMSVIHVEELAALVVAFALRPPTAPGWVVHANHPVPVTVRELVTTTVTAVGARVPDRSVSYEHALRDANQPSAGFTVSDVSLVGVEHTYDSSLGWELSGLEPGPGFSLDPAATDWYRYASTRLHT